MSDIGDEIDRRLRVADVAARLGDRRERRFEMDLAPFGGSSRILLDGIDISGLVGEVEVRSSAHEATAVRLAPALGQHARLRAKLPEARVTIDNAGRLEAALEAAFARLGAPWPSDLGRLAALVLAELEAS